MNFVKPLFMNIYVVEHLLIAACELVKYRKYIFLLEVSLEEEEENKNNLRITPECFDEICVLAKDDITK